MIAEATASRTRIVIADDTALLRQGIARLLTEAGMEISGEAGDAVELMRLVEAEQPDVAIVDIRMPPTHTDEGLVAATTIRQRYPDTGVLVLSQYVDTAYGSSYSTATNAAAAISRKTECSTPPSSSLPSTASPPESWSSTAS